MLDRCVVSSSLLSSIELDGWRTNWRLLETQSCANIPSISFPPLFNLSLSLSFIHCLSMSLVAGSTDDRGRESEAAACLPVLLVEAVHSYALHSLLARFAPSPLIAAAPLSSNALFLLFLLDSDSTRLYRRSQYFLTLQFIFSRCDKKV